MIPPFLLGWIEKLAWPAIALLSIAAAFVMARHDAFNDGWNAHAAKVQQLAQEQTELSLKTLEENITRARKTDEQTIATLTAENTRQSSIAQQLRRRLADQAAHPYHPESIDEALAHPPLLGQCVLDDDTVRLFNDARAGATGQRPGAAGGADAQGGAAAAASSPVTGGELADNDLEVVRRYKELATRHDGLVDWVNEQLNKRP